MLKSVKKEAEQCVILDLASSFTGTCIESASGNKIKDEGETYRESEVEDELERELAKFFEEAIAEDDER